MDRVKVRAQGIKRERIQHYMQDLVEAGRLDEDEIFLWPYQDLRKDRPRLI
ncbi:MAG: hypothetical protein AABX47_04490 [Nanoarchaeota archaeon]